LEKRKKMRAERPKITSRKYRREDWSGTNPFAVRSKNGDPHQMSKRKKKIKKRRTNANPKEIIIHAGTGTMKPTNIC